jgi:hypothetical protein
MCLTLVWDIPIAKVVNGPVKAEYIEISEGNARSCSTISDMVILRWDDRSSLQFASRI